MQQTEIPIITAIPVAVAPTPPMKCPYFIVAYWGSGGWWKIGKDMFETADCDAIKQKISEMQSAGWSHIHICKLPL